MSECVSNDANGNISITGDIKTVSLNGKIIYDHNIIPSKDALISALQRAIDLYGKPGGPWNVPSDSGSWIAQAKEAVKKAKGEI